MSPRFFAGTSNVPLAESVARLLHISLGKSEIMRFADGECRVRISEDVAGDDVFILQSLSSIADQHLVELCLLCQAMKSLKAQRVTTVIPWMGYSKQDKEFRKGEAVSANLVARFIEAAGFDRVITVELHSEAITPYFRIPLSEISTHELFATALPKAAKNSGTVVVSPDMGGKARSERFATAVGLPIVYLVKKRDRETGDVTVTGVSQSVENLNVVMYDDIINTGATVIKTSEFLKAKGAKSIQFFATHAVFAGDASAKLSSSTLDRVVVSDTIDIPQEKRFHKLEIISVAPLLADAIAHASA